MVPDHVYVLGQRVTIEVRETEEWWPHGLWYSDKSLIQLSSQLSSQLSEDAMKETLHHEIVHAVDFMVFDMPVVGSIAARAEKQHGGGKMSEKEVVPLSRGLFATYADPRNDKVVAWMFGMGVQGNLFR